MPDTSIQQDKDTYEYTAFIEAILSIFMLEHHDLYERKIAVTKAIGLVKARDKELERKARIDELNRLIPNPVAEMASIDYKDELIRMFDEIRERIGELSS